jgi:hypothetical protein
MDNRVYSEVMAILNMLGKEYIDLIPNEVMNTIKKNIDPNYQPIFTMDNLNKEDLDPNTINLIEIFYKKYWDKDDEDMIYIFSEE